MSHACDRHDGLDGWPVDATVYLTLDLECDYGTALSANTYDAAGEIGALVSILERADVPLTCFLQTEVLDAAPSAVEGLEGADVPVEFHAHSHTHAARRRADVDAEVRESLGRVRDRFDTDPVGYRFPDGDLRPSDYELLASLGVPFSASVFPSWRPGRFNNTERSLYPTRHASDDVIELPFTVYSRRLRVPVSLSYLKLVGRPFEWPVYNRPPSVVVFDMHMHDLFVPPAYRSLPAWYKAVYARRKHEGRAVLAEFVDRFHRLGYRFGTMNELYSAVREALA